MGAVEIKVLKNILKANEDLAEGIRGALREKGIVSFNLVSSPGSGKTSLLEATIPRLLPSVKVAVVEGDVATARDAERINSLGVPVVQIETGGACHLDANMVRKALGELPLGEIALLFIENVGNLVCPANYDLGERHRVVVMSVAEGEDKPLKYPGIFHEVSAVVLNKTDLLPLCDVEVEKVSSAVSRLSPDARFFPLSCKTGEGLDVWLDWLRGELEGGSRP